MEILKINNFLCIEDAEIEIKRINLFIGEQAQGKSVIAKLIYFFKEYPKIIFDTIYQAGQGRKEFNEKRLMMFCEIFPKYTWELSEFEISYSNKYYSVSIENRKTDKNNFNIQFSDCKKIEKSLSVHIIHWKKDFYLDDITMDSKSNLEFLDFFTKDIFPENAYKYIQRVIYLPAGRSFFSNLEKNIFSLIYSDVQLDFFIKKFGKDYEFVKNFIKQSVDLENEQKIKLNNISQTLINGQFLSKDGQDWIIMPRGKIAVVHASSGQQEVLPITAILTHYRFNPKHNAQHFIIEEPEAHLFPIAQSQIISLISLVYNELSELENFGVDENNEPTREIIYLKRNTFTITTHSPYILTAFNNLIQAGNVAKSKNYQNLDELYKIVPKDEIIDFNDVSAYFVADGTVKSILDNELKLIDASAIDSISRNFADTFEKLVMMEE